MYTRKFTFAAGNYLDIIVRKACIYVDACNLLQWDKRKVFKREPNDSYPLLIALYF